MTTTVIEADRKALLAILHSLQQIVSRLIVQPLQDTHLKEERIGTAQKLAPQELPQSGADSPVMVPTSIVTTMESVANRIREGAELRSNNSFKPNLLRGPAHAVTCTTPPYRYAGRLNSGVRLRVGKAHTKLKSFPEA